MLYTMINDCKEEVISKTDVKGLVWAQNPTEAEICFIQAKAKSDPNVSSPKHSRIATSSFEPCVGSLDAQRKS